jgi:hypothetical protein
MSDVTPKSQRAGKHGLEITTPPRPGLMDRVFRRGGKDQAVVAVTNQLALRGAKAVSMPEVAGILEAHNIGFSEVREQFTGILKRVLADQASDGELSKEEREELSHLQMIFELPEDLVREAREHVLAELYGQFLSGALADGLITPMERSKLDNVVASFGLPEETRSKIYTGQVKKLLKWTFDQAVADRRVTEGEETVLEAMAANLGVRLSLEGGTKALFERFKMLAKIEAGDMPVFTPPIILQRGETCHASLPSSLNEIRTTTKAYRYGGVSGSFKIMKGVRYRFGQVAVQRVTRDVMAKLDTGTLYVTNKRLFFDGSLKNTSIPLTKITHFTLFDDGLRVEKASGRDQYFVGDGDLEVLAAVLENVLGTSR